MPRFAVILPAAGKSSRFHDREKKPFANLDGRAVWLRSAELRRSKSSAGSASRRCMTAKVRAAMACAFRASAGK